MTIDLAALQDDGDMLDIGDGRALRLRIEPDDLTMEDIGDDCYGRIAHVDDRRTDYRGYPADRPDGFDGNAEKIDLQQNNGTIWWQPPKDGPKRGTEEFRRLRAAVNDLASFGYYSYGLELLEGVDAYNRPIVKNAARLGGIEPFADAAYVAEVVADLVAELDVS